MILKDHRLNSGKLTMDEGVKIVPLFILKLLLIKFKIGLIATASHIEDEIKWCFFLSNFFFIHSKNNLNIRFIICMRYYPFKFFLFLYFF